MKRKHKTNNPSGDDKLNYLAAAEMGEEENYNMIDGAINNTPKPSVLERMKEYEKQISENNEKSDKNAADKLELSCPADKEI